MGGSSNRVEAFTHSASDTDHEDPLHFSASIRPMEIHSVCLPPERSTCQALKQRLSEIFFPEDPLHQFKNKSFGRKLLLGLQYFFPIFQWAPEYSIKLLRADVVAGLTIASLAIPQVRDFH